MIESHPAFCCAATALWVTLSVLRMLADTVLPKKITSGEAYIVRAGF